MFECVPLFAAEPQPARLRGGNRATHVVHRDGMLKRICQTSSSANQCFLCAHHAPGSEAFHTASVEAQCKPGYMKAHGGQDEVELLLPVGMAVRDTGEVAMSAVHLGIRPRLQSENGIRNRMRIVQGTSV